MSLISPLPFSEGEYPKGGETVRTGSTGAGFAVAGFAVAGFAVAGFAVAGFAVEKLPFTLTTVLPASSIPAVWREQTDADAVVVEFLELIVVGKGGVAGAKTKEVEGAIAPISSGKTVP